MKNRISRPHNPSDGPTFVYRPQHTDLAKFTTGYSAAFGKGDNVLAVCAKCATRHWSHQSCPTPTPTPQ